MKCLSLKQPFAELVVSGRKTIELRTWNTKFRGAFLVHASGNTNVEACKMLGMDPDRLPRRAVVGKATIYGVKKYTGRDEFVADKDMHMATDEYSDAKYGFLLKDAVRFEKTIPMPGKLGFFDVDLVL
ncbi:MAG: ASCH domain-containing protein [Candidatus Micrarchaeota archaeon]|nr:ASCH domain-containing protein [Candidatus Micrarchaeota archaeon]